MTKEKLKAYIERHRIEWHRTDIGVIIMPLFSQLQEFTSIAGFMLEDSEITAVLRDGYACVEIEPICVKNDIDHNEVFIGDHSNYTK